MRLGGARQRHHGQNAAVRAVGDLDAAAVLADDAPANGEAQAGAVADRLGGEEGIEDVVQVLLGDAGAGVGNLQPHRLFFRCRAHAEDASAHLGQRMASIGEEVDEDLLEAVALARDPGEVSR